MVEFCRHQKYKAITHILDPKWSSLDILIDPYALDDNIEHYVIQFKNEEPTEYSEISAKEKFGWFYMSGKTIRSHKIQPNGRGKAYVVPLSKRKEFKPIKVCEHDLK